jgi:hypothetical protein
LCFSGKGGCGKTHLSRHIAVAAALAGHRVVTVDFDPQKGLSHWWDRRPERLPRIVNMEAGWPDAAELMEMDGPYDLMVIDTPAYHGYADQPEHLKRLLKGAHLILIPACSPARCSACRSSNAVTVRPSMPALPLFSLTRFHASARLAGA